MDRKKYITDLTREEVNDHNVIKCYDKEGSLCILIKNLNNKNTSFTFQTDNLITIFDTVLMLDEEEIYLHIITIKKTTNIEEAFDVIYNYIFKKIEHPMSSGDLVLLLKSLEELFKITPERDKTNFQIGVYGELFSILELYELGYTDVFTKYHDNFFSKHDIEINDAIRLEIKSTIKEKRIHNFKHNQICRNDIEVFICSVLLEYSEQGKTLYELFMEIIKLHSIPESILELLKLMKKCGVTPEEQGISISFEKAISDFRIFKANDLPHIDIEIPSGITNITYDVDCEFAESINLDDFIKFLNNK